MLAAPSAFPGINTLLGLLPVRGVINFRFGVEVHVTVKVVHGSHSTEKETTVQSHGPGSACSGAKQGENKVCETPAHVRSTHHTVQAAPRWAWQTQHARTPRGQSAARQSHKRRNTWLHHRRPPQTRPAESRPWPKTYTWSRSRGQMRHHRTRCSCSRKYYGSTQR